MPELPEVESVRRGLAAGLPGRKIVQAEVRETRLRKPIPKDLPQQVKGRKIKALRRRGKMLIVDLSDGLSLLIHFGMSGRLTLCDAHTTPHKHDHVILTLDNDTALHFRDPRKFGRFSPVATDAVEDDDWIANMGKEPWDDAMTGDWLCDQLKNRRIAIKNAIMDGKLIVGVGNIYASESLFTAGINPRTPANKLSRKRCKQLANAIKTTLDDATVAGGSSLRDHVQSDGTVGRFQEKFNVYGREGQSCKAGCGGTIKKIKLGQRSTYFCPRCQT